MSPSFLGLKEPFKNLRKEEKNFPFLLKKLKYPYRKIINWFILQTSLLE